MQVNGNRAAEESPNELDGAQFPRCTDRLASAKSKADGNPSDARCETDTVFHALKGHRDLSRLVRALPSALQPVLHFDYMSLFLNREITNGPIWYVLQAGDQASLDLTPTRDTPIEAAQALWAFENQHPAVIPRLDREARCAGAKSLLKRGLHSTCALPLATAYRRLGCLNIAAVRPDTYSESEVHAFSRIVDQVAMAVDNALSHAELERREEQSRLLLDLTTCAVSSLELREVLGAVLTTSRRIMESDSVIVALPEPGSGQLRTYASESAYGHDIVRAGELIPREGTAAGRVFLTRKPWVGSADDLLKADLVATAKSIGLGFKAGCVLPLVSRGQNRGAVEFWRRDERRYTQGEVEFLLQIANHIAIAVENALAYNEIRELKDKLALEKVYLEDEIRSDRNFNGIIGKSAALRFVLKHAETVATTDSTVLLCGETGTGKELIARAIHDLSPRRSRPFVKLNCAAIPTGLLESELFGHEKGSFTGAISQRIGRFELANEGTVLLDEIGDIPLELQPKLLRVLQEHEFERLGSTRTLRSDARLIAATNRDIAAMVEERRFRADLFFRLNVFPIQIPPLRERTEDIPLLVRHFVQHFARRMNRTIDSISSETMEALTRYPWPGNIRELENLIERAVILSSGNVLRVPRESLQAYAAFGHVNGNGKARTLKDVEREHIMAALKETKWVLSGPRGAAPRLGMNRSTLQFRMKKLGIVRPWQ
jgi:formate hydrogenlyase transcriptional activator